jgi:hypothetical protein
MWVSRTSGLPASAGAPGAVFEAFLEGHVPDAAAIAADGELAGESVDPTTDDEPLF